MAPAIFQNSCSRWFGSPASRRSGGLARVSAASVDCVVTSSIHAELRIPETLRARYDLLHIIFYSDTFGTLA